MTNRPRPRIFRSPAQMYASPDERISVFSADDGSGASGELSLSHDPRENLAPFHARLYNLSDVRATVTGAEPGSVLEVCGLSVLVGRGADGRLFVSIDSSGIYSADFDNDPTGTPRMRVMVNDACVFNNPSSMDANGFGEAL